MRSGVPITRALGVVGHAYDGPGNTQHVLCAIYAEGRWWYADPSLPDPEKVEPEKSAPTIPDYYASTDDYFLFTRKP